MMFNTKMVSTSSVPASLLLIPLYKYYRFIHLVCSENIDLTPTRFDPIFGVQSTHLTYNGVILVQF